MSSVGNLNLAQTYLILVPYGIVGLETDTYHEIVTNGMFIIAEVQSFSQSVLVRHFPQLHVDS